MSNNLPTPKGGLVAYVTVNGAIKAGELYQKAFGAEVAEFFPRTRKAAPCTYTCTSTEAHSC